MIRRLTIQNFQCHKALDLELDPTVNVIVGSSDVGKSAVLRALSWLVFNKPAGDTFLRTGARQVSVAVRCSRGTVKRIRGPHRNVYRVNGKRMKAFGSEPPPEVLDLLRLGPVNFQRQYDSPFWFGLTAGEVSRQLNAVVDLGVIDQTLASLASSLRRWKFAAEDGAGRLAKAQAARHRLAEVRNMAADFKKLEQLEQVQAQNSLRRSRIESLAQEAQTGLEAYDLLSGACLAGSTALRKGEKWALAASRVGQLSELLNRAIGLSVGASSPVPDLSGLEALAEQAEEAQGTRDRLEALVAQAVHQKEKLCEMTSKAVQAAADLKKALQGMCPLCLQTIPRSPSP